MAITLAACSSAARLDRVEADRAAADHRHVGAGLDARQPADGADAGHDAAAEQAGAVEGHLGGHRDRARFRGRRSTRRARTRPRSDSARAPFQLQARGAVEQVAARLLARERLAQDRLVALAVEAVAAVRIPRRDDVIAGPRPASPRRRRPRRCRRLRGRARSAADRRGCPAMTSRSVWHRPLARFLTSTSPGASGAIVTCSIVSGVPTAARTAARNSTWRRHGPISRVGSQTTSAGT